MLAMAASGRRERPTSAVESIARRDGCWNLMNRCRERGRRVNFFRCVVKNFAVNPLQGRDRRPLSTVTVPHECVSVLSVES